MWARSVRPGMGWLFSLPVLLLLLTLLLGGERGCEAVKRTKRSATGVKLLVKNKSDISLSLSWIDMSGGLVPQAAKPIKSMSQMAIDSYTGHSFLVLDWNKHGNPSDFVFSPDTADPIDMAKFTMTKYNDHVEISRNSAGELVAVTTNAKTKTREHMHNAEALCAESCSNPDDGSASPSPSPSSSACVTAEVSKVYANSTAELNIAGGLLEAAAARVRHYQCTQPSLFEVSEPSKTVMFGPGKKRQADVLVDEPFATVARVDAFASEEECAAMLSAAATVGYATSPDPLLSGSVARVVPDLASIGGDKEDPLVALYLRSVDLAKTVGGLPKALRATKGSAFDVMRFEGGTEQEYMPHCEGPCNGEGFKEGQHVATVLLYCQTPSTAGSSTEGISTEGSSTEGISTEGSSTSISAGSSPTTFTAGNVTLVAEPRQAVLVTNLDVGKSVNDIGLSRYSECPAPSGSKVVAALRIRWDGAGGKGRPADDDKPAAPGTQVEIRFRNSLTSPPGVGVFWYNAGTVHSGPILASVEGTSGSIKSFIGHTFVLAEHGVDWADESVTLEDMEAQGKAVRVPVQKTSSLFKVLRDEQGKLTAEEHLEVPLGEVSDSLEMAVENHCSAHAATASQSGADGRSLLDCVEGSAVSLTSIRERQLQNVRSILEETADLARNISCSDPALTTSSEVLREFEFEVDDSFASQDRPEGEAHIIPVKVFYEEPSARVMLLDNFVSDAECAALIASAEKGGLRAAGVSDAAGGGSTLSESRRAKAGAASADMSEGAERTPLSDVFRRGFAFANNITGYGMEFPGQEGFSVIKYDPTDEYRPHCDGDCTGAYFRAGGRVSTMVMYCEAAEAGGATTFNNVDVYISGKKGQAAFFSYLDLDTGRTDLLKTRHSGCPILEGVKWIATMWMRLGVTAEVGYDNWDPEGNPKNARAIEASKAWKGLPGMGQPGADLPSFGETAPPVGGVAGRGGGAKGGGEAAGMTADGVSEAVVAAVRDAAIAAEAAAQQGGGGQQQGGLLSRMAASLWGSS